MTISIFNLFSIGIGPSSSHTVGPMKAANRFVQLLASKTLLDQVDRLQIELFGSLAFTGKGHGTDAAITLGLEDHLPNSIPPEIIEPRFSSIKNNKELKLKNTHLIAFDYNHDFIFNCKDLLPQHTNGMRFTAYRGKTILLSEDFYSIGGGFITPSEETEKNISSPFPFKNAKDLLAQCTKHNLTISDLMMANECALRTKEEVEKRLLLISETMQQCIQNGCLNEGILPGGLKVRRRAPSLYQKLLKKGKPKSYQETNSMEWLNLFAIAVNEENAAGGRVVTAPTNGASGIVPAVLQYYLTFYPEASPNDAIPFLLTAGAIAILCKQNASISGAEVGCQGEVGVACSMAAAALTAMLGGDLFQIENAAEIAMEHHLGMTCDPIQGLVQIPCIERNAMGAVKAINASRLAMLGDGKHYVSLDKVIATMKKTGEDMMAIYKETSLGGLAANLPEC